VGIAQPLHKCPFASLHGLETSGFLHKRLPPEGTSYRLPRVAPWPYAWLVEIHIGRLGLRGRGAGADWAEANNS
jgi:hypothetical protein